MTSNKSLPILKLFLFPIIAGTAYGAYCYYYEQAKNKQHRQTAPIRYLQQLKQILSKQCKSTKQLYRIYSLINKHINTFVVDPSPLQEKLIDHSVAAEIQTVAVSNQINTVSKYRTNIFNNREEHRNGKSTIGVWSNLTTTNIYGMKTNQLEVFRKIVTKSLKIRQKKCQQIAQSVSKHYTKSYLEQYVQCIESTNEVAAKIERQMDLVDKVLKYQLIK